MACEEIDTEPAEFLTYPVIAAIALPLYFGLFALLEVFFYGKGERFYDRLARALRDKR